MNQVGHWISGAEVFSKSARFGEVFDPALGKVTKQVGFANQAEIDRTIAAAKACLYVLSG